ncbi:hypothetical protein RRG08_050416 [Elysia crispata]|uniref:Uncharacterized protein n=1 Tax=Elysia crispata TaxID=231223 RepID=A0AAE0ZL51_9GAST|nr:hypothetical protein RRG08_050416 [Elysia crispata]
MVSGHPENLLKYHISSHSIHSMIKSAAVCSSAYNVCRQFCSARSSHLPSCRHPSSVSPTVTGPQQLSRQDSATQRQTVCGVRVGLDVPQYICTFGIHTQFGHVSPCCEWAATCLRTGCIKPLNQTSQSCNRGARELVVDARRRWFRTRNIIGLSKFMLIARRYVKHCTLRPRRRSATGRNVFSTPSEIGLDFVVLRLFHAHAPRRVTCI